MVLRVNGALFLGMIITGLIAFFTNQLSFNQGFISLPSLPDGLIIDNPITALMDVIQHSLYAVVFSFILVTIFDTTGTMIGVANQAKLMKNGKLPRARQALLSDSVATSIGAMFGTSPTTAFIESTSGVAAGGRTGLTSLTVAACLFFQHFLDLLSVLCQGFLRLPLLLLLL